jgi:2-C-methyl-D-erythritol 2,4-cyclodiphosphate synthase
MDLRVGQGFDAHRFVDAPDSARPLVLGGVRFEGERGLVGHSDGDAVCHAITDALLGAAGLGDIGEHFPDIDPQWKDADSLAMLAWVVALVRSQGWDVANVDCNVICESPKIAPARAEMIGYLEKAVGAPVSVKGRRPEQMGALGRGEGIVCLAVVLLTREGS